jgi:hypothetical protein
MESLTPTRAIPWSAFGDPTRWSPSSRGPNSIITYSKVCTDAQIASLLLGFTGSCLRQRASTSRRRGTGCGRPGFGPCIATGSVRTACCGSMRSLVSGMVQAPGMPRHTHQPLIRRPFERAGGHYPVSGCRCFPACPFRATKHGHRGSRSRDQARSCWTRGSAPKGGQGLVEHESAVGVEENMRIGVDSAEIFAGKPGESRYVGNVDEARRTPFRLRAADDTPAIRPANCSHWRSQARMASRTSPASSARPAVGVRW